MILEFADGLNLVCICNILFMKLEFKLVTYVAGYVKTTFDYITIRQGEETELRFVRSRSFQMKNVAKA